MRIHFSLSQALFKGELWAHIKMAGSKLANRFEIQKYKRGDNFPIWKKTIITELRVVKIWKYLKPNNPIPIPDQKSENYDSYECADINGMRIKHKPS